MLKKAHLLLIPTYGIAVFIILYLIAALLYPGGSAIAKQAHGFSWLHNYWCDLFDVVAHNGTQNPSRTIAIFAMIELCFSLSGLWFLLPRLFKDNNKRHQIIQICGILSMGIAAMLFTRFHEEVINFGGLFGGIAVTLTFIELYRTQQKSLFKMGVLCLLLSCFNFFIYQTKILLSIFAVTKKNYIRVLMAQVCPQKYFLYGCKLKTKIKDNTRHVGRHNKCPPGICT